jgi:hypothetical protein
MSSCCNKSRKVAIALENALAFKEMKRSKINDGGKVVLEEEFARIQFRGNC